MSPAPTSLEDFLLMLKKRWVECTTYTRCIHKFQVHHAEIPPIMAPSIRRCEVLNTEAQKKSTVLDSIKHKYQGVLSLVNYNILFHVWEHCTCMHFTQTEYSLTFVFVCLFFLYLTIILSDIFRWSSCLAWPYSRQGGRHVQNRWIRAGECQEHLSKMQHFYCT